MCKKKWTAVLLSLFLLLTGIPVGLQADAVRDSMEGEIAFTGRITDYLINPLYEGLTLAHFPALQQFLECFSAEDTGTQTYLIYSTSLESAAARLRDGIIDRNEQITIGVSNALYEELKAMPDGAFKELFYAAYAHDPANPRAGDYIRYTYGGWSGSGTATTSGVQLVYKMQYYTTAAQEAEVDALVEDMTAAWEAMELTEYEQICAIYDFITENVVYDNAGSEAYNEAVMNDTLTMEHCKIFTAYGALVDGTAVCQGYTNLFYRLALEMGLDARIIKSIPAENHVWNITELGGLYYNLDATWDAGEKENGYRYFLKNMEDFTGHTRNTEYDAAFEAAYPMAETSYDPSNPPSPPAAAAPGDLNGDGTVNGKDLVILRYVLIGEWEKDWNPAGADANGDGTADGADVILLRQYLTGWDVVLGQNG